MAKTFRDLWHNVVSWDNLLQSYRKCRRRKRFKRGAVEFDFAWEENLLTIQRELSTGTYELGDYHHFFIHDPKRRKISAAPFRDRVVHHAVVRVLEPIYEPRFLNDSYACRRGKGTHRAVRRAQHFLRRYSHVLKTDIVRFFPNVDHEVLLTLLARRIRDERLMALITQIVGSGEGILDDEATVHRFPGDDLLSSLRPKGLPIGNLTSQFFANVLLDPIDHFLKEDLQIPGYVRYADDLLLFDHDKSRLWDVEALLRDRLATCRLLLHPRKTQVRPSRAGVSFLGFRVFANQRRLSQRSIRRFHRRRKKQQRDFAAGRIEAAHLSRSIQAWRSHIANANSTAIWRVLSRGLRFQRDSDPGAEA